MYLKKPNEFFRYILVGGGAVFIDFVFYNIFLMNDIDATWSKRLSFILGSLWSFFANKYFTFQVKGFKLKEPLLFSLIYITGFILNSLSHDYLFKLNENSTIAFSIATIISVVWNYIGQKKIVFKK